MRFFFLFTILISLQTLAQPFSGDFSNPNRKNKVTITDLQPKSQQWNISSDPGVSVKDYFRDENRNDISDS